MDYCFFDTEREHTEIVLVLLERPERITMSSSVPMKGAPLEWAVRRVMAFIKELGLEGSTLVFKSDQEPAILSLVGELVRRRAANIFPGKSPVVSSQSNGYIERAIQSIAVQIRTMLDVVEARLQQVVRGRCTHAVAWLIEYASVLWSRYAVSADGKTPCERPRGEKTRIFGFEFGGRCCGGES